MQTLNEKNKNNKNNKNNNNKGRGRIIQSLNSPRKFLPFTHALPLRELPPLKDLYLTSQVEEPQSFDVIDIDGSFIVQKISDQIFEVPQKKISKKVIIPSPRKKNLYE